MRRLFASSAIIACTVCSFAVPGHAEDTEKTKAIAALEVLTQQMKTQADILLAPSSVDTKKYADFLKQPDTGIMRLLPREKYSHKVPINGGGAYYSFALKTNEYGHGSDIGLELDQLRVGFAGRDFGLFYKLGDVPIDSIDLTKPDLAYMKSFQPNEENTQVWQRAHNLAWIENQRTKARTKAGLAPANQGNSASANQTDLQLGLKYPNMLSPELNCTYMLRSISSETDLLVAFKIVSREPDGSITIIWKKLASFPTEFAEQMKLRRSRARSQSTRAL